MLVHGGPWAPGARLTWEAEPQFLAARGYRVLQVSFRGSTGLGFKHETASWGQWGLSMQDDLQDAVRWAVAGRLTDPGRVCIYGASYGGYAALMGPVQHPGTYRCAVSHVGVTDIALLFSASDISSAGRKYGLPRPTGNPQRGRGRRARGLRGRPRLRARIQSGRFLAPAGRFPAAPARRALIRRDRGRRADRPPCTRAQASLPRVSVASASR